MSTRAVGAISALVLMLPVTVCADPPAPRAPRSEAVAALLADIERHLAVDDTRDAISPRSLPPSLTARIIALSRTLEASVHSRIAKTRPSVANALRGRLLRGLASLPVDCRDAVRHGDFSHADLRGAKLAGVNLAERLRALSFSDAYRSRPYLAGENLFTLDWSGIRLRAAHMEKSDLHGANLGQADLRAANWNAANLSRAVLNRANLSDATLVGALLSGARLVGADLRNADLRHADLRGANLTRADLRGTRLIGADLRGAILNDVTRDGEGSGE